MPAGASTLRASDRKGWRFLGRHSDGGHGQTTPFVVKGQQADRKTRALQEQSLAETRAYWAAEIEAIEAEFGPLTEGALGRLNCGTR